jgi:hypothetical protein
MLAAQIKMLHHTQFLVKYAFGSKQHCAPAYNAVLARLLGAQ